MQFYKPLYQESKDWRPFVDGLDLNVIDENDNQLKESLNGKRLFRCGTNWRETVSSPNGFTMAFFQQCWKVVEADTMAVLMNVWTVRLRAIFQGWFADWISKKLMIILTGMSYSTHWEGWRLERDGGVGFEPADLFCASQFQ